MEAQRSWRVRGDNGETTLQAWRGEKDRNRLQREEKDRKTEEREDRNPLKGMVKTLSLESVNHKNPAVSP